MKIHRCFSWLILCAAGSLSATANAADLDAGERKAALCLGCHGPQGNSSTAQFPVLAGQQAVYIANQLKAFKSGNRENSIMTNLAKDLGDEDIANLAAYFAAQQPKGTGANDDLAKQGEAKSTMCLGCHGAGGKGKGPFPRLAGQHRAYLAKQLTAFKSGTRKGGPMPAVAAQLSDSDIEALSAYFSSL
ncbi:MAG: c-type cytochrome [Methylomicrobium sp.]